MKYKKCLFPLGVRINHIDRGYNLYLYILISMLYLLYSVFGGSDKCIRLNLIFQVICRFRHLNSNIISFEMIFFTVNFTKISDVIFGI